MEYLPNKEIIAKRIARIFNTFGPRMQLDDGRVVPNFIGQALRKEPLTVYGDGSQTRSFCYVSDLVDGIARLLNSNEHDPTNIGNPREITIREFAETINRITGNPAGIGCTSISPVALRPYLSISLPRPHHAAYWKE